MAKFLINAASIFSSGNELYIEIAEADSGSYDEFSIAVGASGNLRFVRTEFPTIYRATICSDSNPVAEVRDSVVVVVTGAFSDERVTHCRPPVDALSIGGVVREVPAPLAAAGTAGATRSVAEIPWAHLQRRGLEMAIRAPSQDESTELKHRRWLAERAANSLHGALWELGQILEDGSEHPSRTVDGVGSECVLGGAADLWEQARKRLHALGLIDSYWLEVEPPITLCAPGPTCDAAGESNFAPEKAEVAFAPLSDGTAAELRSLAAMPQESSLDIAVVDGGFPSENMSSTGVAVKVEGGGTLRGSVKFDIHDLDAIWKQATQAVLADGVSPEDAVKLAAANRRKLVRQVRLENKRADFMRQVFELTYQGVSFSDALVRVAEQIPDAANYFAD